MTGSPIAEPAIQRYTANQFHYNYLFDADGRLDEAYSSLEETGAAFNNLTYARPNDINDNLISNKLRHVAPANPTTCFYVSLARCNH